MARSLSLLKRRTNLVDLSVREVAGASAYVFTAAANFDGVHGALATVPVWGTRSRSVPEQAGTSSPSRGSTRFLFDPADYTGTNAAVVDDKPFWVKLAVTVAGVTTAVDGTHLVLPYASAPNRPVILQGQAPAGASVADSLELQLPRQCNDLFLQVDGAVDLFLAFERGGPEFKVSSLQNNFTPLSKLAPSFSQLFVRGNAAVTTFSAMMALKDSPL